MFCAGHVLSSLGLAVAIARRRPVSFVAMAALAMSANVFDLDHVIYHRLDDGTGNSLRLHPAHVYFGLIGLALFLGALVDRRRFDYWAGVLGVLLLHLSLDAAAMWVRYDMAVLAAADAGMVVLIPLLVWRWPVGVGPLRLGLFALGGTIVCDGAQGFLHFGLGLRLDRDVAVVLVPAALSALAGPVFWLLFRGRSVPAAPPSRPGPAQAPQDPLPPTGRLTGVSLPQLSSGVCAHEPEYSIALYSRAP